MHAIELIGISKHYAKVPAVCDVSLKIGDGEVVALLGPSGSGKTTLLRLIAGFEVPDQGSLRIRGEEVSRPGFILPPEYRHIGMVFQDYALFPHLTVSGNIAFGISRDTVDKKRQTEEIARVFGLGHLLHRYPSALSGGQQQRVALARALAPRPGILMLDEPFSGLDTNMRIEMRRELRDILKQTGTTAVLVTHDSDEAFAMADRVAVLSTGRLEQYDTPDVVYHLPRTPFVASEVGQADLIPGVVQNGCVVTELGTFQNNRGFPTGKRVVVMIRPDDIDFTPDAAGEALIHRREFKGSENLYTLKLSSGQHIRSSLHSLSVYPESTRVTLTLKATHTVIFECER